MHKRNNIFNQSQLNFILSEKEARRANTISIYDPTRRPIEYGADGDGTPDSSPSFPVTESQGFLWKISHARQVPQTLRPCLAPSSGLWKPDTSTVVHVPNWQPSANWGHYWPSHHHLLDVRIEARQARNPPTSGRISSVTQIHLRPPLPRPILQPLHSRLRL